MRVDARGVALVGFGTVGRATARLLTEQGRPDLDLRCVCTRNADPGRAPWVGRGVRWTPAFEAVIAADIDIVIELVGGLAPARGFVERALAAGKSVVTANKQLISHHGARLTALARRAGAQLRFEAAVGGGIPVIRALQEGLAGDDLVRVAGVLNGTSTYILSRMGEEGVPFAEALREAQVLGLAEADPAGDVDGLDARAKLAILAAIALRRRVRPASIACRSIAGLLPFDLQAARQVGCVIRQVAWAERDTADAGRVHAGVSPALVPEGSASAGTRGAQNTIHVAGRRGGVTTLHGTGAGGDATAVAVMSDVLSVARQPHAVAAPWPESATLRVTSSLTTRHYVRAPRRTGSAIGRALGVCAVAIDPAGPMPVARGNGADPACAWLTGPLSTEDVRDAIASALPSGPLTAVLVLPLIDPAAFSSSLAVNADARPDRDASPDSVPPRRHADSQGAAHA